jgi:hypothetical protein
MFAGLKFPFSLEPVVQFATRRSTPRQMDFVGAPPDLFRGRLELGGVDGWRTLEPFTRFSLCCSHIV